MRKTSHAVELAEAERAQLRTLAGRGIAPARMLTRARIRREQALQAADNQRIVPEPVNES